MPKFWMATIFLSGALGCRTGADDGSRLREIGEPPASGGTSCPDVSVSEVATDCPWAGVARDLQQALIQNKNVGTLLDAEAPGITASMQNDAKIPAWLDLWGYAINFDENAHGIIVDPGIVDLVNQRMGAARQFNVNIGENITRSVTNAGVQHTYGYLFSTLNTPYGYKRARWVNPNVSYGFGLEAGLLGPSPSMGTLYMNVTYFAGSIAFAADAAELAMLAAVPNDKRQIVAEAIRNFDYKSLKVSRLSESLQMPGSSRRVVLRTDLVKFPRPLVPTDVAWLIYSVYDSVDGRSRLISAFPVGQATVDKVTAIDKLGNDKAITTVYNAYVPGVSGIKLIGSRTLR